MSETSVRQAEIAIEQRHVDRVYARLGELRAEAARMRDKSYEHGREATPEALYERDVMVHHANRTLQALDAEAEGLVFGRLDLADGDAVHIGRLGIRDPEFDNLLVDWRAPLASAFYQATPENPLDVVRRRVIRSSRETVVDLSDDLLDPQRAPRDMRVVGDGALMASLSRARSDSMRNIVATIQKEQDDAIRAPEGGVTEITGGPGTGKTAVALHRAAYLLYRDQRKLGGAGVLVVGPSPVFMSYISRVLPSMGEHNVELRALGEVLDGLSAGAIDDPRTAEVKGSSRMVQVLRRALRLAPPDAPDELRMFYRGVVLKLQHEDLKRIRRRLHSKGAPPNRSRMRAADALLEALWHKAKQCADERFQPDRERLITEIGERIEFHRFLVSWWPPLYPMQVLRWLSDPGRLAKASRRLLSAEEIDLLAKSWADVQEWTVADVALIDELRVLAGAPPKRRRAPQADSRELTTWAERTADQPYQRPDNYDEYSHVVVDESQDLSPMQWRMVGRRGRHASWTVVGDPVQSSWPDPAEAARARQEALSSARSHRRFTLRTNYRTTSEIFAVAADAVRDLVPADDLPNAVRTTGVEPVVREVSQWPQEVRAAAEELLEASEGTVGVITAMRRRGEVGEWLAGVGQDRLRVVGSLEAKGMEYDAVLLVDPDELAAESSTGRRALYVALSRATQRLTVLKAKA
ncbi:HelD family protein [Saccharopolyspora erythraea]|uniref:HelD family protein n=1 Tax=Saccharopolyspora erythraea TaxID=1836 RepID=UPI0001D31066|nr:ATP-binding domain-containing protein [Saccharopolyspora erythraea]